MTDELLALCAGISTQETLALTAQTRNESVRHTYNAALLIRNAIPEDIIPDLRSASWRERKRFDSYLRAFGRSIDNIGQEHFSQWSTRVHIRVYQLSLFSMTEPTVGVLMPRLSIQRHLRDYVSRHPLQLYQGAHLHCSFSRLPGEKDKVIVHTPVQPFPTPEQLGLHWTPPQHS